jgi:hypothetical protein
VLVPKTGGQAISGEVPSGKGSAQLSPLANHTDATTKEIANIPHITEDLITFGKK